MITITEVSCATEVNCIIQRGVSVIYPVLTVIYGMDNIIDTAVSMTQHNLPQTASLVQL